MTNIKPGYHAYPEARRGLDTEYEFDDGQVPVMRGWALDFTGVLGDWFPGFMGFFLLKNAGFFRLRNLPILQEYEPRYDPGVIATSPDSLPRIAKLGTAHSSSESNLRSITIPNDSSTGVSQSDRPKSVAAYTEAYKSGKLTPTAVAETLLELIKESSAHQAAWADIKHDQVLAQAEASTRRYQKGHPLSEVDGVMVGIKDELDIEGHVRRMGSTRLFTPESGATETSWCVTKLLEAGAVVVGKTNMHEMGVDTTNINPRTSTPLNPHNPNYATGGSSGGSAYAVAAGLVPITHGVDGGGSIRIPSSFCGVYGLKPSHRRVSRLPTTSLACSNSCDGPIASNMADLEVAYRIMSAPNPADTLNSLYAAQAAPSPTLVHPSSHPDANTSNKILGIYEPWLKLASPEVLTVYKATLQYYTSVHSYTVQPIQLPHLPSGQAAHALTILSEAASPFLTPATRSEFSAAGRLLFTAASAIPGPDLLLAQKMRNLLMQHLAYLWKQYPGMLIVSPTTPDGGWHIAGGKADLKSGVSDATRTTRCMAYVWLANFTGCPAISVPVGMMKGKGGNLGEEAKVPVGMMAMGEWGNEEGLLRWGRESEDWAWRKTGRDEEGAGVERAVGWVDVMQKAGELMP